MIHTVLKRLFAGAAVCRCLLLLSAVLPSSAVFAQGLKEVHDHSAWQQFNAMEFANFSPTGDEWLAHPGYRAEAPVLGAKTFHRMMFNSWVSKEEGFAATVDSLYASRLKSLLLETGERAVDLQWVTEGTKIEGQLSQLQRNVSLIRRHGGKDEDYFYWKEIYNMFARTAIPMVRDSYQPGYKRMEEYQGIYEELRKYNLRLLDCFKFWNGLKFVEAMDTIPQRAYHPHNDDIAARCLGRWKLRLLESPSATPKPKKLRNVWSDH